MGMYSTCNPNVGAVLISQENSFKIDISAPVYI